ncbi:MAG: aminoacetone oxidase family FAD-binding enzyme [Anaerolineaceae bacterium]|nr:aminoacetone oxidase family FAD-binding enzyme [Anaerolineaceae bacterium]
MKQIAIIGAGPAGIMAALQAVKSTAEVHLFESNPKIGKKLLVTGSGRCNITNMQAKLDAYDTDEPDVLASVLAGLSPQAFRALLAEMGIFTTATDDGWVYPFSFAAGNVVDLLLAQLHRVGVKIHYAARVQAIRFTNGQFILTHDKHDAPHIFDLVCVASGGKAMPDLGSDGKLFAQLAVLGHQILAVQPALAPILFADKTLRSLDGVRLDVEASIWQSSTCLGMDVGNVIFTQWGMNGPAVMNLSHLLPEPVEPSMHLQINFLAGYEEQARAYFAAQQDSQASISVLLGGFLNQKITAALCKKSGIPIDEPLSRVETTRQKKLLSLLTAYRVQPTGTRGFKYAQLSSGGVPLGEVQKGSLESKLQPGLFLAGEVLNVVGPCGGFNLHWAFASGYATGQAMAAHVFRE